MVKPSQRKEMAKAVLKTENIAIRLICEIFGISSTAFRYQAKTASENRLIEMWLLKFIFSPESLHKMLILSVLIGL